jgi:hypothetical protein
MSLTRLQKIELKKIDSVYRKIEKLSETGGITFDDYQKVNEFHYNDLTGEKRRQAFDQGRNRQEVFERSRQHVNSR